MLVSVPKNLASLSRTSYVVEHSDDEVEVRRGLEDDPIRNLDELTDADLHRQSTHSILEKPERNNFCSESRHSAPMSECIGSVLEDSLASVDLG